MHTLRVLVHMYIYQMDISCEEWFICTSGIFNIVYKFFTVTLVLVECSLQAMDPECDKSPCPRIKAGLVTPYHCAEVKEYQQRNRLDN